MWLDFWVKKISIALSLLEVSVKGEGGAFLHDGKVKVINDYDISIIHYGGSFFKLKNINKIKALSEEIAFKINIKQIDLGLIPISKINGSHLTIGHFDFVHGHHILYGKNPFWVLI